MKIGFDTRQANVKGTGIGRYTFNIYTRLQKAGNPDIVFFKGPANKSNSFKDKLLVNFWEQFILPFLLLFCRIKVFHITKNLGIPFVSTARYIITIHDIIPLVMEKEYLQSTLKKLLYLIRLKWAVKRARIIIADSVHTKNDLIKYLGISENKIKVIYLGIDNGFRVLVDIDMHCKIKQKYGIEKPFILGIGSNEPRKNAVRLIKAFQIFKEKYPSDIQLVIIGKPWLQQKCESICYNDVSFIGYVDEEDLVALYNCTEAFVFPSLYEGFGLPPLEAMACGAPVITSNLSSLPELVGDSAVLIDPYNIEQIADAIWRVISDKDFALLLKNKGLEHVRRFTWEKSIRELLELYRECLN